MMHPALVPGAVALITGAASGIGLGAACRFARMGLRVVLVDLDQRRLDGAAETIRARSGDAELATFVTDVSDRAGVRALKIMVEQRFGDVDILMNNAAIAPDTDVFGTDKDWESTIAVNLWGVIFGCQTFGPAMVARGRPGLIINSCSKNGITTPPGTPVYNVSKAGVKAYTEALEHQLRNIEGAQVSAHLLIPGYVFTGLTADDYPEKPDWAWTPEQTVDFMLASLTRGDFYILCPDGEVDRALDEKRILWAAGDIVENRPALSRWHPAYSGAFAAFAAK